MYLLWFLKFKKTKTKAKTNKQLRELARHDRAAAPVEKASVAGVPGWRFVPPRGAQLCLPFLPGSFASPSEVPLWPRLIQLNLSAVQSC